MRKGERVKLNDELTKTLTNYAGDVFADKLLDFYTVSYLPIISDSLASIADSLEILTKGLEERENDGRGEKED